MWFFESSDTQITKEEAENAISKEADDDFKDAIEEEEIGNVIWKR